jgi:hypothetical protein
MIAFRVATCLLAAVALTTVAGCGCSPSVGQINGTVSFDGKRLHSGTVTFIGADGKEAYGPISPDGEYRVSGVAVGEARISVVSRPAVPEGLRNFPNPAGPFAGGPTAPPEEDVIIPSRYSDPQQSGLKCAVKRGKQDHLIDLTP